MDEVNNQGSYNSQDMDSGEIVVPSIRPGVKREYNMMMKAQSELISPSRRGRVTRSQNANSSRRGYMKSAHKIIKKVKVSTSKKMKINKEEKTGAVVVANLDTIDVSDREPKLGVVQVESSIGHDWRNFEFIGVDTSETEKLGLSGCFSEPLCIGSESPLPQVGGSDVYNISEDEKTSEEATSVTENKSPRSYTHSASKWLYEELGLGYPEAESVAVDTRETEKLGPGECINQLIWTESLLTQAGSCDVVFINEDEKMTGGGSDLGHERTSEFTSGRRYIRSTLKQLNEETELGSGPGVLEVGGQETLTSNPDNLEMKMSKKVELKSIPSRLKDLLKTRLLEGLHVRYRHGSKRRNQESKLVGIIKGTGILCSCNVCNWKEVITPNLFEMHANSGNKRPLEYIYLENGKSLRDVLNSCKANQSDSLLTVIQKAIGTSNITTAFCFNCKELIPEGGVGRPMLLCDSCVTPKESDPSHTPSSDVAHRNNVLQWFALWVLFAQQNTVLFPENKLTDEEIYSRCMRLSALVQLTGSSLPISFTYQPEVPESAQISTNNQPEIPESAQVFSNNQHEVSEIAQVSPNSQSEVPESVRISSNCQPQRKRQGRLTRKDLRMHKSVLADDLLPEGAALSYVIHGQKRLEGFKKNGAIFCTHCRNLVSPSQFESHAGFPLRRKPYMSIYTSNGVSLHQLSLEMSKIRKSNSGKNDDICSICEGDGELLCCENCPRAFHRRTWYCKYCKNMFEKEKYAERSVNAIAAGRVPSVDPLADITQRCIRIVATFETDVGGCIICREHDFSKFVFDDRTIIICDQCDKEYHIGCLKEQRIVDLQAIPENEWFCSNQCTKIHSTLQILVEDGEQMLPDNLSKVLKEKMESQILAKNPDPVIPVSVFTEPVICWRLLSGKRSSEDTRLWLSGAVSIFHDQFDPISDSSTGCLDLIPHMVYGRNLKGQDFCNMYCAILTVDTVVVSAGIFRIFGKDVAELPLVATKTECQGKGYFQSLYFCIEKLLASLSVKVLVLPAASEAVSLWKNRFGFKRLGKKELSQYQSLYHLMIFQGTSVLHKWISDGA